MSGLPPMPPIPPLTLPPPVISEYSYQIHSKAKQLRIINGQQEYASTKEEVQKKLKNKFDQAQLDAKQTKYSDQLGMINITLYKHCVRCDRWIFHEQFDIHMGCHAAIVEPNLLLGDKFSAQSRKQLIERMKVTHVVNAASQLPNYLQKQPQGLKYLKLTLYDNLSESLFPHIEQACQFIIQLTYSIEEAHDQNGIVFVHCAMGKSRSVSAILIYLLKHRGLSINQGLLKVQQVRSFAKPNFNYMNQLLQYEQSFIKNDQNQ